MLSDHASALRAKDEKITKLESDIRKLEVELAELKDNLKKSEESFGQGTEEVRAKMKRLEDEHARAV